MLYTLQTYVMANYDVTAKQESRQTASKLSYFLRGKAFCGEVCTRGK
jgi:hypothetical protein